MSVERVGEADRPRSAPPAIVRSEPATGRADAPVAVAAAARERRWLQPIVTRKDRWAAWFSLMIHDHGFFRLIVRNRHRVSEELWRSAQPFPADIHWAARSGIKTIVSLRNGQNTGFHALEREACQRAGLAYQVLPLFSREPPSLEMLREAEQVFAEIAYPALIHCKSGSDRAGIGAALYLLIRKRRPAAEAAKQLGLRFGHVRHAKTGVLDAFVEVYRERGESRGLSVIEWAERDYDPVALRATFQSNRAANLLVDRLLGRE